MKVDNTCYLVGCPETPQYEFKTHLGLLDGIIVRLCEKHTLEAFNVREVKLLPRVAREAKYGS